MDKTTMFCKFGVLSVNSADINLVLLKVMISIVSMTSTSVVFSMVAFSLCSKILQPIKEVLAAYNSDVYFRTREKIEKALYFPMVG